MWLRRFLDQGGRTIAARFTRVLRELTKSDEEHLAHELREWAASTPGTVPIAEAPLRKRVRLAGEVRKVTFRSAEPFDEFEVLLYDGSGEIRVVFLGRRSIPGVDVGSRLVVEGVVGDVDGERRMLDPEFELVPPEAV
jgi:hypothetical protein